MQQAHGLAGTLVHRHDRHDAVAPHMRERDAQRGTHVGWHPGQEGFDLWPHVLVDKHGRKYGILNDAFFC